MKIASALVFVLAAASLRAEAPPQDLDGRLQLFMEISRPSAFAVAQVNGAYTDDQPGALTGLGLRFMGEVASSPHWYYEVGFKANTSSKLALNGPIGGGTTLDDTGVKFTASYWSIGTAYLYQASDNFALGMHLEGRGEQLSVQGPVQQNQGAGWVALGSAGGTSTYLRLWGRLSADYTFSIGDYRPYLGAEVGYTPMKTAQTQLVQLVAIDPRTVKAISPGSTAGFYLGCHF